MMLVFCALSSFRFPLMPFSLDSATPSHSYIYIYICIYKIEMKVVSSVGSFAELD